MGIRLAKYWETIRTSLWFLPGLMTLFSIALAIGMVELDRTLGDAFLEQWGIGLSRGAEGSRQILSTIASSMVTVAGVVFSVTIVALSLASNQFGPRLLRGFIRDPGNQFVLGTFIGTFVYCLMVLPTIRTVNGEFVPYLAVRMAILLAIFSLGVLIYFIHHVSFSIQAPHVVYQVSLELQSNIDSLYPEELGHEPEEVEIKKEPDLPLEEECFVVRAQKYGYLEAIETDRLILWAQEHDLLIRLLVQPGQFLIHDAVLLKAWPGGRMTDQRCRQLADCFSIGPQKTPFQDVAFSFEQMVEVGVRALSPGINDPFTAQTCIDHLSAALCQFARRRIPSACRYDTQGNLRVIAEHVTFADVLPIAFDQLRHFGRSNSAILLRILDAIQEIADYVRLANYLELLRVEADLTQEAGSNALADGAARRSVTQRYHATLAKLRQAHAA